MAHWVEELKKYGLVDGEAEGEVDPEALAARLSSLPPGEDGAALLQTLAVSAPKKLAKEARRLLHLWRSRGLIAAEAKAGKTWRLESRSVPLAAFLSHIDGNGDRLLAYSCSRSGSPYVVMVAVGNDETGLTNAEVFEPTNKREYRGLLETIRSADDLTWVEADPSYVRALLLHFYRLRRANRGSVPRDFELYRSLLGPEEPLPPSPIYARLDAADVAAGSRLLLAESSDLLTEEEMLDWYLEGPAVDEAVERIRSRRNSPLIVSSATEKEVEERIKNELLAAAFTAQFRALFARRLEEMAFIFWETGRRLRARQAVAVARALLEGTSPALIPFFREFINRSLAAAAGEEEEKRTRLGARGLVIPDLRERLLVP